MSYSDDRVFSDRYLDQVRAILGPMVLTVSTDEEDMEEATDLTVLRAASNFRVGVRIRRQNAARWAGEFTIRSKRSSGAKTELRKIMEGWGDWLFYAIAADDNNLAVGFHVWTVIDLDSFRFHFGAVGHSPKLFTRPESHHISNGDGTEFTAYVIDSFPSQPSIVIKRMQASSEIKESAGILQCGNQMSLNL